MQVYIDFNDPRDNQRLELFCNQDFIKNTSIKRILSFNRSIDLLKEDILSKLTLEHFLEYSKNKNVELYFKAISSKNIFKNEINFHCKSIFKKDIKFSTLYLQDLLNFEKYQNQIMFTIKANYFGLGQTKDNVPFNVIIDKAMILIDQRKNEYGYNYYLVFSCFYEDQVSSYNYLIFDLDNNDN